MLSNIQLLQTINLGHNLKQLYRYGTDVTYPHTLDRLFLSLPPDSNVGLLIVGNYAK